MGKYLVKRLLHGLLSVIAVVFLVMLLVYSLMDREKIFVTDSTYNKLKGNQQHAYRYQKWEEYGYLDYVPYSDYLTSLGFNDDERSEAMFGRTPEADSETAKYYISEYTRLYQSKGYTIVRLNYKKTPGNSAQLFAYKDVNVFSRLWKYFTGVFYFDHVSYASGIPKSERRIYLTWHDPAYGGKFAPAIMGNGTKHKYLVYFDDQFPFIHQNLVTMNLGKSSTVNSGIDVWSTMTDDQGGFVMSDIVYPTGYKESSADDLHSATYVEGSHSLGGEFLQTRYTDDYTSVKTYKNGMSRMGYSFIIGIFSSLIAYVLGLPLGVLIARKKDKLADKIATLYVIFMIAVPSLAYIFMFKAVGIKMGLPTTFEIGGGFLMYVLPVVSLALPSIAGLMKWMRRYMIDQSNSDYVKFARSSGLSEGQIFRKHIMKNAAIPIVHGIPGSILGALVGAIITERVYVVPGVGNILTKAINMYDNSVIVGLTMFYAVLSIVSLILGDILMSLMDPRISFSTKTR